MMESIQHTVKVSEKVVAILPTLGNVKRWMGIHMLCTGKLGIENEMGCLHSLIISSRSFISFFSLLTGPKRRRRRRRRSVERDSATWSEYPLTACRTIRESGLALIFKKDLSSLTLYSSQECTRRHKMTESIFSAHLLHAVQGENREKASPNVWTSFESHFLYIYCQKKKQGSFYCSEILLWFIGSQPI